MDVNKLLLSRIFDSTERLDAPLFQRPYVWEQERNWEPLWEAIEMLSHKRVAGPPVRPHFMGTIVLSQLRTPPGGVHARQIIDGQQRLTTLQLALAVARDIANEYGHPKYERAFRRLTDNNVPLSDSPEDVFKVWPTNADREDFRAVMMAGSPAAVRALPHADPDDGCLVPDAYLYFADVFRSWLGAPAAPDFVGRLDALYHTFVEGLQLVVINLEEKDDPQEIFETLNALGTPLLPADLVKNFLFHQALEQNQDTDKLYEEHWSDFDDDRAYWREEVRQGRLNRPRIDLFLYHYLTSMLGETMLDSQLFDSFKGYYAGHLGHCPAKHMEAFRVYADTYRGFDGYPRNSCEELFFYRLRQLDVSTLDPLMLEVCRRYGRPEDRASLLAIMQDLESFVVRRVICGLTPKNYNRFFTDLIRKARRADDFSPDFLRQMLLGETATTSRWPTDNEFRIAWMGLDFYERIARAKTRIVLEAIERALHVEKTESLDLGRDLTIEHLMPQGWGAYWPLGCNPNDKAGVEAARERRQASIHKIGNLTLLTQQLNSSQSNGPWPAKLDAILTHSALNLNRPLKDVGSWSEDAIAARGDFLFKVATRVWPRPDVPLPDNGSRRTVIPVSRPEPRNGGSPNRITVVSDDVAALRDCFLEQSAALRDLVCADDPKATFRMANSLPYDGKNWFVTFYPGTWGRPYTRYGIHWCLLSAQRHGRPAGILRLSIGVEVPLAPPSKPRFMRDVSEEARKTGAVPDGFTLFAEGAPQRKLLVGSDFPLDSSSAATAHAMFRSATAFSAIVARHIHDFDAAGYFIERISYP